MPGLRYQYVRGQDFYDDARAQIDRYDAIRLEPGTHADRVVHSADVYRIETDQGALTASAVIDTRPLPRDQPALLYQCFLGAEVTHSPLSAADVEVAGLMEAMSTDKDGFRFVYILPLAPDRSLIEITRFCNRRVAPNSLREQLSAEIMRLHGADTQIVRTEAGVLPMGLVGQAPRTGGPQQVFAGLPGGALRPASGYAFQRIQAWADACAASVTSGRGAIGHRPAPAPRRRPRLSRALCGVPRADRRPCLRL